MLGCGALNFVLDFCVCICCVYLFVCCLFVFAGEGEMRSATLGHDVAGHWPGCARPYLAGMYSAVPGRDVLGHFWPGLRFLLCHLLLKLLFVYLT